MSRLLGVVLVLVLTLGACVKNDCDNPNNNALYRLIESTLLDQKASEESDYLKWYWCEAPMRKRDKVPDGMLGPLANLRDGSEWGYGRWVQVSAADAENFSTWTANISDVPGNEPGSEMAWRYAATARFVYQYGIRWYRDEDALTHGAAEEFAMYVRSKTRRHAKRVFPAGAQCFSLAEATKMAADYAQCVTPAANSPVSRSGDSTSGSSSSGSSSGGDWGSE